MQAGPSFKEQGLLSLRQGDAATAVHFLSDAVRVDPADAEAWAALGVAFCKLGQLAEGVAALQRAVALRPSAAPLQFNLGRALELRGQVPEALECYRRALELDPAHPGAAEATRRLAGKVVVPGSPATPTLGDFILAAEPSAMAVPAPVAPAAPPPFRPSPVTQQVSPYAGYSPPATAAYPGPYQPHRPAPPRRSGTSPWVVIAAIFGGLLVAGGAVVLILAAILLPAVQRAREAALRVERRQQESALRSMSGYRPSRPQFSPPVSSIRLHTAPIVQPPPTPVMPQTPIVVPRPHPVVIPEPPRFTPPPVPEPPHFSPPTIPVPVPPRMLSPHPFPGGDGPRLRYGPPGSSAPIDPAPMSTPNGAAGASGDGMLPQSPGSTPAP